MILANENVAAFLAAGAATRSTASTSGPTRRRSSCCSRSSPTSTCRRRPRPSGSRRSQAAVLAGEISKRVAAVRRAVRARARGVPVARPARAQAGAVRPARISATPGSRAPRTATSPRRSGATRTSSSTARLLRELGLVGRPRARRPAPSSPSTPRSASERRRKLEYLADDICLAWLLERRALRAAAGTSAGRAR